MELPLVDEGGVMASQALAISDNEEDAVMNGFDKDGDFVDAEADEYDVKMDKMDELDDHDVPLEASEPDEPEEQELERETDALTQRRPPSEAEERARKDDDQFVRRLMVE